MSPSVWWADRVILRQIRASRLKPNQRIWLDVGTMEGQNPQAVVDDAIQLRDALIKKGWQLGKDLVFVRDEGAGHDEKAWGRRMRDALRFIFPPSRKLAR
jgi:predicted alpha/beta superfamily hydrolase